MERPFNGAMPGHFYEIPRLPKQQDPSLGHSVVIQKEAEQYIWYQTGCRSYWLHDSPEKDGQVTSKSKVKIEVRVEHT